MLGADISLEGLDPAQERLWACVLWAQATFRPREGTGRRKGQPVPNLIVAGGVQGYFLLTR